MLREIKTAKWDAELTAHPCDRFNNAELTLTLKLFLQQVNPPGDARQGTHHDYGDATEPTRRTIRWTDAAWRSWTQRFVKTAGDFWHGKFWLITHTDVTPLFWNVARIQGIAIPWPSMDFFDRDVRYRPNVWCRFKLQLVNDAASAHHSIDVVRLHPSERWFGSHSTLYDNLDTQPAEKRRDSRRRRVVQRAHVHEVGHLLGLDHVDVGQPHCPVGGNTNAADCYGIADDDMHDVMGSGMQLRVRHAAPWREAMVQLTGVGSVADALHWQAVMRRHYPRTEADVAANRHVTTRPSRN